ncbi:hypothetical protein [Actinomadura kijaniata]|uniref:hypothetical protein n=1 Tax=Actinomadura kijaniata TaxID=46161 RepID=UPI000A568948|nr:hypothetical protein [Actinomadura kijaniata]
MGTPPFRDWHADHPDLPVLPFGPAAEAGEVVINGIDGANALKTLGSLGAELDGKVLLDYAIPYVYDPGHAHPWQMP